jgi:hypothetical protein
MRNGPIRTAIAAKLLVITGGKRPEDWCEWGGSTQPPDPFHAHTTAPMRM